MKKIRLCADTQVFNIVFGGYFFDCYAPSYGKNADSTKASNNVHNIATELKKVSFYNKDYKYFSNLKGFVVYCDPPYENTISRFYKDNKIQTFDTNEFWSWCLKMSKHNIVFVSGYKIPNFMLDIKQDTIKEVFSSEHKLTGINTNKKVRKDKLFMI